MKIQLLSFMFCVFSCIYSEDIQGQKDQMELLDAKAQADGILKALNNILQEMKALEKFELTLAPDNMKSTLMNNLLCDYERHLNEIYQQIEQLTDYHQKNGLKFCNEEILKKYDAAVCAVSCVHSKLVKN